MKLGEQVAQRLETEILKAGWPVGYRIGSEENLAQKFGVSRPVFREAQAIVELNGLVQSRRGQAGGLFVGAPAHETIITGLRTYFALAGVEFEEFGDLRRVLDVHALTLAMQNLSVSDVPKLRALANSAHNPESPEEGIRASARLWAEILRLANHPALTIFIWAVARHTTDAAVWNGAGKAALLEYFVAVRSARQNQVEAMIMGDDYRIQAMEYEIQAHARNLNAVKSPCSDLTTAVERLNFISEHFDISHKAKIAKKSEALARLIAQRLQLPDMQSGDKISLERDLMATYGISRSIVREALRILERYGIGELRIGRAGGLHARAPICDAVVTTAGLYLASAYRAMPSRFHQVGRKLQVLALEKTIERLKRGDAEVTRQITGFRAGLRVSDAVPSIADALECYDFLAATCDAPSVQSLMRILVHSVELDKFPALEISPEEVLSMKQGFIDALEQGDAGLALMFATQIRRTGFSNAPSV